MQPDPREPNSNDSNIERSNEAFTDAIDEMMEEEGAEYYDAGDDGDSGADTGADDTETGAVREKRTQVDAQDEPALPMQLPQQQPPQQPAYDPNNPKGFARVGSLFADADGNIVTRDGRVMAAKGEPARHWSNMSKQAAQGEHFKKQNEALTRQIDGSRQLLQSAKELADLPTKLGLSREDYNEGVQLIAQWNRDPLTVARDIVSRTLARGFNATDIMGKSAGDALEMGAIRALINEVVAPQRAREAQETATTQQRQAAQTAYDDFLSRYPDSAPHGDAIAALMREQKISATEAYHEVRYFALENGLDFTQPLGPQVAAASARAQQRPNGAVPQVRTQRAPMVAGNGGGNRDNLTNETNFAPADSSWGDILNSVMRNS